MNKLSIIFVAIFIMAVTIQIEDTAAVAPVGTRKEPCEDLCNNKSCMCEKGPTYTTPECKTCCDCKGTWILNKKGGHGGKTGGGSKPGSHEDNDHDHGHKHDEKHNHKH